MDLTVHPKLGVFAVAYTIFDPLLGSRAFVPFEASFSQANPLLYVLNMQNDGPINRATKSFDAAQKENSWGGASSFRLGPAGHHRNFFPYIFLDACMVF
jgi:hypothetical protein